MQRALVGLLLALVIGDPAQARGYHHPRHHDYIRASEGEAGYYTNVSGHRVRRPVFAHHAPSGASAHCSDGSYSFSEHHSGTCSHHGGVESWL